MTPDEKAAITEMFTDMRTATVRTFDTGATRSPIGDKFCYAGFLSPIVLQRFAAYMHHHRVQADGSIRDARNWQKGIPQMSYLDSMMRHFVDVWLHQEGHGDAAVEDIETALCGLFFNTQGMLYEVLKGACNGEETPVNATK